MLCVVLMERKWVCTATENKQLIIIAWSDYLLPLAIKVHILKTPIIWHVMYLIV